MTPADGLRLNISDADNALDLELAMDVAEFFELTLKEAKGIGVEVISSVGSWTDEARADGLSRKEQEDVSGAFSVLSQSVARLRPRENFFYPPKQKFMPVEDLSNSLLDIWLYHKTKPSPCK